MLQEISAGPAAWAAACYSAKGFQTVARAPGEKEASAQRLLSYTERAAGIEAHLPCLGLHYFSESQGLRRLRVGPTCCGKTQSTQAFLILPRGESLFFTT